MTKKTVCILLSLILLLALVPALALANTGDPITITFAVNYSGSGQNDMSVDAEAGIPFQIPENSGDFFVRAGYSFIFWNTSPDGSGMAVSPGEELAFDDDITLYAQWEPLLIQYTVSFNSNGGTSVPPLTVDAGSTIEEPNPPTRAYYRFDGWYTDNGTFNTPWLFGGGGSTVEMDTTLDAKWVALHTVAYHTGFGPANATGIPPQSTGIVHNASYTIAASVPNDDAYTFLNWNTAPAGESTAYSPGETIDAVTENIDLYAQWLPPVDVTYHPGQTPVSVYGVPGDARDLKIGSSYTLSAQQPTSPTHTFTNWNTAENGTGTTHLPGDTLNNLQEDVALYAQWQVTYHTVTYAPGSAPGADMSGVTPQFTNVAAGERHFIQAAAPQSPAHTFAGWKSDVPGDNQIYHAGTGILVEGNITLTAQWDITTHTVMYSGNGHTAGTVPPSAAYQPGTRVAISAGLPLRTGHIFAGWRADFDGQTHRFGEVGFLMPSQNVTLNAQWIPVLVPPVTPPPSTSSSAPASSSSTSVSSTSASSSAATSSAPATSASSGPSSASSSATATPPQASVPGPGSTPPDPSGGPGTSPTFTQADQARVDAQTGNPIRDLLNGNVPLGSLAQRGAWSLVSLLLSLAGFFSAVLLLVALLIERKNNMAEDSDTPPAPALEEANDARDMREKRTRLLQTLAIVFGALTGLLFLLLDRLSLPMVFINRWTWLIALVFVAHIALMAAPFFIARMQKKDDENPRTPSGGTL